jgi:glycosyltransferase involved in cell wall biosynthesis
MRILHVIPTYLPATRYGGPIFAVHSLCRALASRGHGVEVVTTNINGSGTSPVPIATRVDVDCVSVRYFASPFLSRLSFAPAMSRILRHEMPHFDIVHLHSVFLWPTWAAARLARRARVPYVISPRGMLVKDLIQRRNRLVKSAWIELIEKGNLERASAIHATSRVEVAELRRFGWRLPPITLVPNGVDRMQVCAGIELSPDVREIAAGPPFVLFLGRISWKKGLDRLLRAFARTGAGTLAIVGPDDEGLAPQLLQLARDLGIDGRVRFLTRVVLGADKEHLYASAQLFVLPSYSENFGNTVLEAMQSGCPVVVTAEVGAAEIVRDAGAGIVVAGDPDSLAAAIDRLTGDRALADGMGAAGRRHVHEHYSWSRIAAEMEALYERVRSDSRRNLVRGADLCDREPEITAVESACLIKSPR